MQYIPNQPVFFQIFGTEETCVSDEVNYKQLVGNTDVTQFQMDISVCDGVEQFIENPTFDDSTYWTLGDNWTISPGFNLLCVSNSTDFTFSDTVFTTGYYEITIVVDSIEYGTVTAQLGSEFVVMSTAGTYKLYATGDGVDQFYLVADATTEACISSITAYPLNTDFEFFIFDMTDSEVAHVTNISNPEYFHLAKNTVTVDVSWASLDANNGCFYLIMIEPCEGLQFISNTFSVQDYSNSCTLLINACNNSDAMGFVFSGSTFSPRIRVEAKLRQAKYETDVLRFTKSSGTKLNYNYTSRKSKNLAISLQPEYVHDFLRLLLGFDNVFIDNVEYVVDDDEYNIVYIAELDNYGSVSILVSKKTQNVKNALCSDDEISCNLGA